MANNKSSKHEEPDPFSTAVVYRLRRDALMIVSSLNRGHTENNAIVSKQLTFVQAQLCTAAVADPRLSTAVKIALVKFHAATVQQNNQVRREARHGRRAVLDFEIPA